MIRKLLHLDAPPEAVARLFHDLEGWPRWMSGVRSVTVLERQGARLRAEVVQVQMGQRLRQVIDFTVEPHGLLQDQVEGRFRRWQARWRFVPSPAGRGTTVAMALDLDLGPLRMVIPNRMVEDAVDHIFRSTGATLRELLGAAVGREPATLAEGDAQAVLAALRRGEGVVLEVAGRRYRLVPDDSPTGPG